MTVAEQLIEEGRQKGLAEARAEARAAARQEGREEGRQEGREEGREEGRREVRIAILRRLLALKFKLQTLDLACEARLLVSSSAALDRYLERVLTADSLAAVFAD